MSGNTVGPNRRRFYSSLKWKKFMDNIKNDRLDNRNINVCEKCGQPMIGLGSVIGHHIIELDEENVKDYNISLNPHNIELLCVSCHNKTHDRFQDMRKIKEVIIVYGPPGAGKMDYVRQSANKFDIVIEIDRLHMAVSPHQNGVKVPALASVAFTMRDALYDLIKYRSGKWNTAYIVAGLPFVGDRERLSRELDVTDTVLIETNKSECYSNIDNDPNVPNKSEMKEWVDKWYDDFSEV